MSNDVPYQRLSARERCHRQNPTDPATEPPAVLGARWLPLTRGKWALVDEGDFAGVVGFAWQFAPPGYAQRSRRAEEAASPPKIRLHRHLLGLTRLADRTTFIDHINGDGFDNRRSNLRLATTAQNAQNLRTPRDNKSGYKGVYFDKHRGRWKASIKPPAPLRRKTLGYFDSAEDAARAYNKAAQEHFGEFAMLNTIRSEAA